MSRLSLLCTHAELAAATGAERADWLARLLARMAGDEQAECQRDHDEAVAADEWFLRREEPR